MKYKLLVLLLTTLSILAACGKKEENISSIEVATKDIENTLPSTDGSNDALPKEIDFETATKEEIQALIESEEGYSPMTDEELEEDNRSDYYYDEVYGEYSITLENFDVLLDFGSPWFEADQYSYYSVIIEELLIEEQILNVNTVTFLENSVSFDSNTKTISFIFTTDLDPTLKITFMSTLEDDYLEY